MEKTYCVHVYMRPYEYENVKAKSPQDAEDQILRREFPDTEEVSNVEVMVQCPHCGTDNDTDNKKCEDCGRKL